MTIYHLKTEHKF